MSVEAEKSQVEQVALKSAEFVADLLCHLGRAVLDKLGPEEGEKTLRQGLRNFGLARGRRIRKTLDDLGLPISVENFAKHYDFPMFAAYRASREVDQNRRVSRVSFCPLGDYWQRSGKTDIGLMYCEEVDDAIREGFDPQLGHQNLQNPLRGDALCLHIDEIKK